VACEQAYNNICGPLPKEVGLPWSAWCHSQ